MREISGLAEIARQYDAFLIDQFGVLHDGRTLYPGARRALEELYRLRKPVVIFTNSGKRNSANHQRVIAMGIAPELFVDILSSGEVAWAAIRSGEFGAVASTFIVGRSGDDYAFDGLGLTFTDVPEKADLILILGSNAPETSLERYRESLAAAAARRIPALCCNPDRHMLTPSGLQPAPGAIAAIYAELGGPVTWIGKPYPRIFRHAMHLLGDPPASRALSIGDSIAHDVRGGRDAGLGTALVRTGVSASSSDAELRSAMAQEGAEPNWILPDLRWE